MANGNLSSLPAGFVLDQPTAQPAQPQASALAAGFVLDSPQAPAEVTTTQPRTRVRGPVAARERREAKVSRTNQLLSQLDAGELTSAELTPEEVQSVQEARIEEIPEIASVGLKNLVGEGGLKTFGTALLGLTTFDPAEFGKILTEQFPQIGITQTPQGEFIAVNNETGAVANINREGPSLMDALQIGGVAAAFTPGGRVGAAAPQLAARITGREVASPRGVRALGQAVTAATTEAGIQAAQERAGGEFDVEDVALAGGLGAGAEFVAPVVRGARDIVRGAVSGAEETAEQAARRAALEAEGLTPTRPQVTRQATEFQTQQELAKTTSPVRARLDQQEARLNSAFEQRAVDTQGNVVTSTNTAIDEVLERSIQQDEKIGALYNQAREAIPDTQNIDMSKFKAALNRNKGFETKSGGVLSAARSIAKDKGLILRRPETVAQAVQQRINVATAEDIRQQLNSMFKDSNFTGKRIIRDLKNALDDDVMTEAGEDFFKASRASKAEFETGLDRAGISKFDSRKSNVVRDMLENKISPDTFLNDVVFAKKWRTEDLNQLKSYLNQTEGGRQAWNDLRAQTVEEIRSRAFTGPLRDDGVSQSLSRSALNRTLNSIETKLNVLFSTEERDFFKRMQEVAKLREPPPGTQLGAGPSAQAIQQVKNRFPLVGPILDSFSNFKKNKLILRLPRRQTPQTGVQRDLPPQAAQVVRVTEEQ